MSQWRTEYDTNFVVHRLTEGLSSNKLPIDAAATLLRGQVMGREYSADAVADAGNTGDGVVSSVTIADEFVQEGDYTLTCVGAATNGGTFKVIAPDGTRLDDLAVGVAYASHIGLTVSDGAADWALNDQITVTVALGDAAPLDLDASDGTQIAHAIPLYDKLPGETGIVSLVRLATIDPNCLTWPDGATDNQKSAALAQLRRYNIYAV